MIVHDCKLIFIHINRTGGVSIESAFGQPKMDHSLPHDIIKKIGWKKWNEYFKFAIIRNPWDRMVSVYCNRKRWYRKMPNFEEWLIQTQIRHQTKFQYDNEISQLKWIVNKKGKILVDFIGRFERLKEDFQHVCEQIGIQKKLPHKNQSRRSVYQTYYSNSSRKLVEQKSKKEIEKFGYVFAKVF
jgi:hypothetical protein